VATKALPIRQLTDKNAALKSQRQKFINYFVYLTTFKKQLIFTTQPKNLSNTECNPSADGRCRLEPLVICNHIN